MYSVACAIALTFILCGRTGNTSAAESLPAPPTGGVPTANPAASAAAAARGRFLFERNCAHCHGDDARGDEGPSLYGLRKSDARIRQIIEQGVKGEMPKFLTKFNDAELMALIAYLRTLKS